MKSQIIPVLISCMFLPWIVSRVFQLGGQSERLPEICKEWAYPEIFPDSNMETEGEWISYEGLSAKQINYLIP
jgi:hypothetical protein